MYYTDVELMEDRLEEEEALRRWLEEHPEEEG